MAQIIHTTIVGLDALEMTAGGYRAVVCPALGGNCLRLTHLKTGAELLRTPETIEEVRANPNVYGTPLLFPPNRITGGEYLFEGRHYQFPMNETAWGNHIHGFLSRTPFEMIHSEADGEAARIIMRFSATAEKPYLAFPHAFRIILTLTLDADGLHHEVQVLNDSTENMPVGLGFHTTLNAPFLPNGREEDCQFRLGAGREWLLDEHVIPNGRTRETSLLQKALTSCGMTPCQQSLSQLFEQKGAARLTDRASGRTIEYTVDENFRFWMVHNGNGRRRFLCPEPQSWMNDAPNRPFAPQQTGFRWLSPGESLLAHTRLRLI